MAIRSYIKNGKKLYEAYVNGFNARETRVQQKRSGIETLRRAEQMEFELKRTLAKLKEEKIHPTWDEWLEECLNLMKVSYRPSTLYSYETTASKWIKDCWNKKYLSAITKMHVHELLFESMPEETTLHTRKYVLKIVKRIFQMAVDNGRLDRNPCNGMMVKVPESEKKVLTNKEVEIFLSEARITNHRFYAVWALALFTGCRSRELLQFLKELKLKCGAEDFVLPHLTEWTRGEAAKVTKKFCKSLGLTEIRFHDLRATFITNLLARGESLARGMAIVGHSDMETTNVYLRKAGIELKGGTEKLGYKIPSESAAEVFQFPQSQAETI